MDQQQIRERLAKIKALFAGATTPGERQAAQAAIDRLQQRIEDPGQSQQSRQAYADEHNQYHHHENEERARVNRNAVKEHRFSLRNPWSLRLFLALCRSQGLKPYRLARMRRTSVCVRLTANQVEEDLWPEFLQMDAVLTQYLNEEADRIIADCINPDRSDALYESARSGAREV